MISVFELPPWVAVYLCALAALLGLVLGSALNCLALRLAAGKPWASGERSACPDCGHVLSPADLIPVLSWLLRKGRCRYCGGRISIRYPITEALLAAVFLSLLLRFGLSLELVSTGVLCSCLLALSLVDLDTHLIPDRFLVIPAAVRLAQLWYEDRLLAGLLPGLILGGGLLVFTLVMDRLWKKETMGGGDIKLLGLLGLFFPLGQGLLLVILACLLGIGMALRNRRTPIAFAPALSAAAWITLLAGEGIVSWYLGLYGGLL